jgi:hypothetical protein
VFQKSLRTLTPFPCPFKPWHLDLNFLGFTYPVHIFLVFGIKLTLFLLSCPYLSYYWTRTLSVFLILSIFTLLLDSSSFYFPYPVHIYLVIGLVLLLFFLSCPYLPCYWTRAPSVFLILSIFTLLLDSCSFCFPYPVHIYLVIGLVLLLFSLSCPYLPCYWTRPPSIFLNLSISTLLLDSYSFYFPYPVHIYLVIRFVLLLFSLSCPYLPCYWTRVPSFFLILSIFTSLWDHHSHLLKPKTTAPIL